MKIICLSFRHGPWKLEDEDWKSELRTPAFNHAQHTAFIASGANQKHAMKFFSCVSEPLLVSGDDALNLNTPIHLLSIPPPLHLKLSFNSILTDLKKVWPDLDAFLKSKYISTEAYHGGSQKVVLEGNQVVQCSFFFSFLSLKHICR